jgi:hypothetical protein
MRSLAVNELAAIVRRTVVARDLIWITAKDRATAAPAPFGFWSDAGDVSFLVRDALTGTNFTRSFTGGAIISIDDIENVADLTVRTVNIELSGVSAAVEQMYRGNDVRLAPVQIYRLFINPETGVPEAAAKPRFVGIVDEAVENIAGEGQPTKLTLTCASQSRELSRSNPDVRSHESQLARASGDDFYKDTAAVADWDIAWGQHYKPAQGANAVSGRSFGDPFSR